MSVADPIADMLTRLRNGFGAKKKSVIIPGSNINREVLTRLVEEGYLAAVDSEDDGKQGLLIAHLKYDENEQSVIDGLKRISKQGRRVYVKSDEIPKERNGLGTIIVSTSHGVLTDAQARKLGVGGELICSVW